METPVVIIGPALYKSFLEEYSSVWYFGEYKFISSCSCVDTPEKLNDHLFISTFPVEHVDSSFAAILYSENIKIVYTGDTRPCEGLAMPGADCDLLIHEATFDDDNNNEAVKKNHSTWREAHRIAQM